MIEGKKLVVVLPAYNAYKTLSRTISDIPTDIVDEIVLVDDGSIDNTTNLAEQLGINHIIKHPKNLGYGANQKTCYNKALTIGADIIVMLHPDYQYDPKLISPMTQIIAKGIYPVVMGSRILGKNAVKNGMPVYKYFFNRALTFIQNLLLNQKLSEYHTGYRAYSKEVLLSINYNANNNDFIFDNQVITQILYKGFTIGEISCPARYFPEASSINFKRSIKYGLGVLYNTLIYMLNKYGIASSPLFRNTSS
ncbi:MAG: glycosyltransferase family 2 protein [Chitinophagaceae bacterium]|nr:glycosyltransferase family 2 protein [Chitinophagaceae bacterium]